MIDLVLMSKEAQRHVIYNTEFKVSMYSYSPFCFSCILHRLQGSQIDPSVKTLYFLMNHPNFKRLNNSNG